MSATQTQSKTIVMIGQKGMPASWGGVEQHVHHLSIELTKAGNTVVVYSRKHYADSDVAAQLEKTYPRLKIQFLPTIATKHFDAIMSTFLSTMHALFVIRPDVYHYHSVGPSLLSFIPRIFARKSRVVVTFHSVDRKHAKWSWFAQTVLTIAEWTAANFPHETVTVSRELTKYTHELYGRESHYIPNGVPFQDMSADATLLQAFDLVPNQYVLLVTRFVPHKGVHFAIEAWKRIPTRKKLVLVGDATMGTEEYADQLRALAAGDDRILFTGYQTGERLRALYTYAYASIQPSLSEGLSIALLEAAAYGKGVVASDIPENMEIIQHGGFPFTSGDVDALTETLKYIVMHPEAVRVAGRQVQAHVREHYDWMAIAQKTGQVYDQQQTVVITPNPHEAASATIR